MASEPPTRRSGTFVLVGCGAAKRDEPALAQELYTSTYFQKKRALAEAAVQWVTDYTERQSAWAILSAEHGIVPPTLELEPYDTTVDDLRDTPLPEHLRGRELPTGEPVETELDLWARRVASALEDWLCKPFRVDTARGDSPCSELIVLAGQRYLDPLRERGAFEGVAWGLPVVPRFPFQEADLGGIGEQMAWLDDATDRLETAPTQTAELSSFGGGYERERALWQVEKPPIPDDTEQVGLGAFEDVDEAYRATEQQTLAPTIADGGDTR